MADTVDLTEEELAAKKDVLGVRSVHEAEERWRSEVLQPENHDLTATTSSYGADDEKFE